MAIAFDAFSTTGLSAADQSWTHTPVGTPRAVVVFCVETTGTLVDRTVTYGGVPLTHIATSPFQAVAGTKDGVIFAYFLGSGIPTGAQTVLVDVTTTQLYKSIAITCTGASDCTVNVKGTLDSASTSAPSVSFTTDVETVILAALHAGTSTGTVDPNTGTFTELLEASVDSTATTASFVRRTSNPPAGSVTVDGWTYAGGFFSAEAGVFAVAIREGVNLPNPSTGFSGVVESRVTGLHFTIDGRPAQLDDWTVESTANWGHRSLTGRIPKEVTWAEQEAPVQLWVDDGTELFAGKLTQDPRNEHGQRFIRAGGYAEQIAASKTRMFYRIDGGDSWVDADSEPHELANKGDYDLTRGRAFLKWRWANNADAFTSGEHAGFVLWMENSFITRYSVRMTQEPTLSNFDFVVRSFTGPAGSTTLIDTNVLTSSPVTFATTLATPEDALWFRVQANANSTPALRRKMTLTQIKIYGRTLVDDFFASDVVADVASDAGLDSSLVQTNNLEILPLDWTEDHTSLLSYMCELTDWVWRTEGPPTLRGLPRLVFMPWGGQLINTGVREETWTAYLANDVVATLEPMRRYNRVVVPYRSVSGVAREASSDDLSPDPFPGKEIAFYADELEQPQKDRVLAKGQAENLAAFYSSKRTAGRVQLGRVLDATGVQRSPYKVRPGGLLNMPDSGYGPQRIQSVTYRQNQEVSVDLNDDFNVARLLADIRADRPRARRKKRDRRLPRP